MTAIGHIAAGLIIARHAGSPATALAVGIVSHAAMDYLLPEYRGSGGTAILYSEIFKSVRESGQFRHAEVVQIGVENEAMRREMENFGIDFYKTHRTYSRDLY